MNSIDIFIQNYFTFARTDFLTGIMRFVTSLFDASIYFVLIVFCVCVIIYLFRNYKYVILFISALFSGGIAGYLLKSFFNISRPLGGVIVETGKSFPSNHAVIATIFFVMLMYIFDDYFESFKRVVFNVVCVFGILVVCFSRVYLGVHWLSDVLGGAVLGGIVSYLSILLFKYVRNTNTNTSMLR